MLISVWICRLFKKYVMESSTSIALLIPEGRVSLAAQSPPPTSSSLSALKISGSEIPQGAAAAIYVVFCV